MFNILNKILLRRFFIFDSPHIKLAETQVQSLFEFQDKVKHETYTFDDSSCLCGDSKGIIITDRDRWR
jgi:hypothetical protein